MLTFKDLAKTYKGIILFFVAMFAANIVWKLSIKGDESDDVVLLFNTIDISGFFNTVSHFTTKICYICIHLFDRDIQFFNKMYLHYSNDNGVCIIWGCTGIKQSFIFLSVMLLARGSWTNKLWFVPLGLLLCYLINIMRITAITAIVKHHPEAFDMLHGYLFKYLYYGLIFLIWIFWEEVIVKKN